METLAYFDLSAAYETKVSIEADTEQFQLFEGFNWQPPSSAWIRLLSTLMAILMVSITSNAFASGSISARVRTNGSPINVRSSPAGDVVGSLSNGTQISLTGRRVNGWLQLTNGNYVSSVWVRQGISSGSGGSGGGSATQSKGILKVGDKGSDVTRLQNSLKNRGVYNGPVTGYYGDLTELAVRRFQASRGLRVDGIAGSQTLSVLGISSGSGGSSRVATRGSDLYVRSGPGTNYPVVGSLNNGSAVTVYATTNGWYRIGDGRWVSSAWVRS